MLIVLMPPVNGSLPFDEKSLTDSDEDNDFAGVLVD
jgi:hypothetical protein